MTTLIKDRRLRANRARKCDACGCLIPSGEVYVLQYLGDGGDRWTWAAHDDCHQVAGEYADAHPHMAGPWDLDEFIEWLSELEPETVWGPWAAGILSRYRAEQGG